MTKKNTITLWTTVAKDESVNESTDWNDTFFWSKEGEARDNADSGGHQLVKVVLAVQSATVVASGTTKKMKRRIK